MTLEHIYEKIKKLPISSNVAILLAAILLINLTILPVQTSLIPIIIIIAIAIITLTIKAEPGIGIIGVIMVILFLIFSINHSASSLAIFWKPWLLAIKISYAFLLATLIIYRFVEVTNDKINEFGRCKCK